MKKLLTSLFLLTISATLFSQIRYEIELLPDNETYLISFNSSVTYMPPTNKIVSGQVTIRMPHGIGPNAFQVVDLIMETPGAQWAADDVVRSPSEAPSFDYISFALTTPGVDVYNFQAGVSIPIFSFKNGGEHCADSVYIIRNVEDPFFPPNSLNVNIGNSIKVLGGGNVDIYGGFTGTGSAAGTPETLCINEMTEEFSGCDSVLYQGSYYQQDTVFEIHYTSSIGCDSVFLHQIRIGDELTETVDTTICEGDLFKGVQILQDEVITQNLTSVQGCDSIVTYLVKLVTASEYEGNITVLSGDMVNGIPVFSDTTIISTLTNSVGCDSTATIHVTVYNGQPTFIDEDLCLGESFNGIFYMSDTSFVDTLASVSGFDSLVFTNITVNEHFYISDQTSLCLGEPFPGTGIAYPNDTTFVQNLQTIHGCDSFITTSIHVVVPEFSVVDTSICLGETYMGIAYQEDQVFTETITTPNGCDSLVYQVNLTVHPEVSANISGVTEICQGEETKLTALGGNQFSWSTGEVSESITVSSAGTFDVIVSNGSGCENVASVTVTESGLQATAEIEHPRCHFDLSGTINFTNVSEGFEPYSYSIDGGNFFTSAAEFPNLSPDVYEVKVQDKNGCYWEETVEIIAPDEIWVDAGDDWDIRLGESLELNAFPNFVPDSILWSPPVDLECPTCLETTASPRKTTTYTILLFNENGCSAESKVSVLVRPQYEVYVPNAFSPNGDGINDSFMLQSDDNVKQVRRMAIFERWGGLVFSAENFQPNDINVGWDGKWRNEPAPQGMYVWVAEVEFLDGKVRVFEGSVGLFR